MSHPDPDHVEEEWRKGSTDTKIQGSREGMWAREEERKQPHSPLPPPCSVPHLSVVGQRGSLSSSELGSVLEVSVRAGRCRCELLMGL